MTQGPVETTLISLNDAPPSMPAERREGERFLTLFRVGSLHVGERRELCLIKNVSAGGMRIRAYATIDPGTVVSIELKCGQPVGGQVTWYRDGDAGIEFDSPIDVVDLLSAGADGPRPRMPRVQVDAAIMLREGANLSRVMLCDLSQGDLSVFVTRPMPWIRDHMPDRMSPACRDGIITAVMKREKPSVMTNTGRTCC